MHPILQQKLKRAAGRSRSLRLWSLLALCWAATGFLGLAAAAVQKKSGLSLPLAGPFLLLVACSAAICVLWRFRNVGDLRTMAREIERRHPALDGRLLTAMQQEENSAGGFGYLQKRLLRETLHHDDLVDWAGIIPRTRVAVAKLAHWLSVVLLVLSLWALDGDWRKARLPSEYPVAGVNVSPGDTELEKGQALVVLARFGGHLPSQVELVLTGTTGLVQRLPLVKSLSDPMFGGSVPEVSEDLLYRVEYAGQRTRDFTVRVYEHPRLERADADLTFPEYTGLEPKHITDTRRISGVQGTRLDLALKLNKPVTSAVLVARDKSLPPLRLTPEASVAAAHLAGFHLLVSHSYDLVLVDAEGRTNKAASQFVFSVLTNRAPELRFTSPRGDLRVSPLQEIAFEGTVWDDFGVQSFGLGYVIPGSEPVYLELGRAVPRAEKRSFQHVLPIEELKLEPDQLISWFLWADDNGPDGQVRRTTSDLFFGEVRPFDEVFREGQSQDGMSGQSGGEQGQPQGSPSTRLVELQKQIISATWKVQRERGVVPRNSAGSRPPDQSSLHPRRARLFFGAPADPAPAQPPRRARRGANPAPAPVVEADSAVLSESQEEALNQAKELALRQEDPRTAALWRAAVQDMEKALARLKEAEKSPAAYSEALAAEQSAYQSLLKLQEHEFQVSRSRQRSQGQQGGQQGQMQQQLEQMELTQTENRYETQRQAQRPRNEQRREQLQVQSRLQELARRQQDLNERLKELQSALQEARTEQEKEEIRRQLKRLQEQEQQMLSDLDELRQRMEQPQNQSSMAEQRQQLEQTRQDMQRAAEAAAQGSASQALAAGTRAQNQLQEMRDQLRDQNSSQFSEDLREMRQQARELAQKQQEIANQIGNAPREDRKSLSGPSRQSELLEELARQKQRITNIVDRATEISREAEVSEPLLSRELHDTLRNFAQSTARDVQQLQEQLLTRGLMTRNLMDRLRDSKASEASKLLETIAEMLRMEFTPQARDSATRAATDFEALKNGVERAAESVLGNDTEALHLAQDELRELTAQLQRESALAGRDGTNRGGAAGQTGANGDTNGIASATGRASTNAPSSVGQGSDTNQLAGVNRAGTNAPGQSAQPGEQQGRENQQARNAEGQERSEGNRPGQAGRGGQDTPGQQASQQPGEERGEQADQGRDRRQLADSRSEQQQRGGNQTGGDRTRMNLGGPRAGGAEGADLSGTLRRAFDTLFDEVPDDQSGPITGEGYAAWSDRLRDVEDLVDIPDLRNELSRVRDRARQLRQEFKRDRKKPDWAVVRLQIVQPLVEVQNQIAEELARRESREALVPIDRDPVPARFSDLVRRYYEQLGK